MRILLLPEAERDLEIGADFYESQKAGLGVYFNDCLASDIESLNLYAGIHEKYRGFYRSLSKRFPFSIYYKLNEDVVEIFAVLDARQDPRKTDAALESPRTMP
ncbi:MAG: type II toxin-antitoxin system RelE/ParE family toxin [Planctomycetaceae bacterium]|nr:type II toxin-antitoxin system RelE/ParE family toxin [Planctomycetaceae bacterium]